jgi:hypothetical protein
MLALSPDGTEKAIWDKTPAQYSLDKDPHEDRPLAISERLETARVNWFETTPIGQTGGTHITIDEENAERLRILGYQE